MTRYNDLMPQARASTPQSAQQLTRRITALEKECAQLQTQLDEMSNEATSRWLKAVQYESVVIREIQNSLSWKITKPLRMIRHYQRAFSRLGVRRAWMVVIGRLRRRSAGGA